MTKKTWLAVLVGLMAWADAGAKGGKLLYDEALIPQLNVPRMATPPTIDGTINPAEWRDAVKVMGMVSTHSLSYKDRPVSFWLAWDATHLYIAARSDILPGHRMYRNARERHTVNVVFDDAYEFGIFMHDRNKPEGEVSSFLKIVLNSLGAGEYMKIYPSIGQNMYNWTPEPKIANRIYEADGKQWWDMEMAMDLKDLQMPVENKAGDALDILLAGDLKNPGWQWLDFPSASGHLEHYGFSRTILTDTQPYVQVERIAGLHDEKIDLQAVIHNPGKEPVTVNAALALTYNAPPSAKAEPRVVVDEKQSLTVPAGGSATFKVVKAFPGLAYEKTKWGGGVNGSDLRFDIKRANAPEAAPIYRYACNFAGTDKSYLVATPRTTDFEAGIKFNPASNKIELSGDTLDAKIPAGSKAAALTYAIQKDGTPIESGRIAQLSNLIFNDIVELKDLKAGKYQVQVALVDAEGKTLVSRNDLTFEKKDEAKVYAHWWQNRIGHTERILPPFEALKVTGDTIACTRRAYELDALGLPRQIVANGGNVLTEPARIVITVAGKDYVVPTKGEVKFTSKKDWRVEFTGAPVDVAGVRFTTAGWMEQDGLVNLELTYGPEGSGFGVQGSDKKSGTGGKPTVLIDDLRVEWPVDGSSGSWMSCIGGVGGNYAPRTIDKVPDGKGQVWDTLSGIGKAGSKMLVGNWENNLWVGNDQRGLCWFGDSDQGWVPNDATPAHSLFRDGKAVIIRNHLINLPKGQSAFVLDAPRTVHLQYNATPFRHFAKGWRLTQVSAANGFSAPNWKANEKENNKEYFSVLSMPSADTNDWAYYLAKYKAVADGIASKEGWYSVRPRLHNFHNNQIALRGYMDKTLEPGLYGYFGADWMPGEESLNASYRDYMLYLMNRHVREGGLTHYYFDISFTKSVANLIAGFGYRLPDGRVQPGSMDGPLREWYKRVWALMAETGHYPGGVSGHATHSIALRALPWTDAILDSEYPMKDPVTVYTKDAMIAMSCPHNFGVNINHLGFMLPEWGSLHDAGMGGSGFPFNSEPFRHFGIAADDVEFLAYWRNQKIVKPADAGVLASVWKRPGKAIIQVLNYGLDPAGQEKTRSAKLTLDLQALGVPSRAKAGQVRIQEIQPGGGRISGHSSIFDWYQKLPDTLRWPKDEQPKVRPPASPTLDPASGKVDGVELFYHDSRFLLITWDEEAKPAPAGLFSEADLAQALAWGLNRSETKALDAATVNAVVKNTNATVQVQVWTRPGTVMLRVANTGDKAVDANLTLDLEKLGVKVQKVWSAYTQCIGGTLDAMTGAVQVKGVPAGGTKVVFIDTY